MTSEHDFCFSIFITFLWLYLCLAAWVKLVNHGAMLRVISYHFCIFHLYNGNINISNSQSHGGSRSPHALGVPGVAWPITFLISVYLFNNIDTLTNATGPSIFPAWIQTYFRLLSHASHTITVKLCKAEDYSLLTDAPKVWDKIILRFWYPSDSWKRKLIDDVFYDPSCYLPPLVFKCNTGDKSPNYPPLTPDNTHHHHLPAPAPH